MERAKAYGNLFVSLGLTELSVKEGDWELTLKREAAPVKMAVSEKEAAPVIEQEEQDSIKAPLTGVFYASESPDAEPFVKVGDKVKKGDLVCTIETMKMFNDVVSDMEGTIVKICVENGQLVEYNEPLFLVEQNEK